MHAFLVLWSTFFDICRLRLGPEQLPKSVTLLKVVLLIYIATSTVASLAQFSFQDALLIGIIETSLLVSIIASLLYFTHHLPRLVQTLTALAGTGSLLSILSLPVIFWLYQVELNHGNPSFPLLLIIGLVFWNLLVYAHILSRAVSVPFWVGFMLTVIISYLSLDILSLLFPLTE